MIITRKHLPRRTFLKGVGVAMALPMLDAMVPALARGATEQAIAKAPNRLAWFYVPNGVTMDQWMPTGAGKDFELSRILKPFEKYKADMQILSGLGHEQPNQRYNNDAQAQDQLQQNAEDHKVDPDKP